MGILIRSFWSAIKGHNVATLFYGAAVSRAIGFAVAPLLTRLYGPAEFGEAAVFFSFVSVIAVLVTGSYEKALLVSRDDESLSSLIALTVSLVCGGVIFLSLTSLFLPQRLDFPSSLIVYKWRGWFPLAVGMLALNEVFGFWALRQKEFKNLAITRTIQNAFASIVQIALGGFSFSVMGLMAGPICGQLFYVFFWGKTVASRFRGFPSSSRFLSMTRQLTRHWRFPIFTVPSNFVNTLAHKLPLLYLGPFFGNRTVGLLSVGLAVGEALIGLFGKPLEDVMGQRMSAEFLESQSCKRTYKRGFLRLLLIGALVFIPLAILAPFVFPWVFGGDWKEIGVFVRILSPLFFIRFVVGPLSYVFYITNKQQIDLFWQIGFLLATALGLVYGSKNSHAEVAVVAIVGARMLMYVINGYLSFHVAHQTHNKVLS